MGLYSTHSDSGTHTCTTIQVYTVTIYSYVDYNTRVYGNQIEAHILHYSVNGANKTS